LWQSQIVDGLRVIRVWSYITANEGFLKRTLDYASFMVSAVFAAQFVRQVDLIVGTSPQFFTVIGAYLISALRRRPWVFELRDIWPESIKAVGAMEDGPVFHMLERLEMFLYRKATAIASVTHSFRNKLIERGVPAKKIFVVTNGADLTKFSYRHKPEGLAAGLGLDGRFVAGYVGTHGMAHGLDIILNAAAILQSSQNAEQIRFLMLGDGARKSELVARAIAMSLKNVVFIDTVPRERVQEYWALLDVSIIHLKKDPLFKTVIPSKLFECMAMGLPVLHGVQGESADIVERERVGEVFEPENSKELAHRIMLLASDERKLAGYRVNCIAAAPKYDRKNLALTMLAELERVTQQRRREG
jgi:glycosyltransferase involved in cell wall biosynthesis